MILAVVGWLVRVFSKNQGTLRAQLRRALEAPELWRPFQDLAKEVVSETIQLLSVFPQILSDPDWQLHVGIAMQTVVGTLNNILINKPGPLELSDPRTVEELAAVSIRYLRLESAGERKRPEQK